MAEKSQIRKQFRRKRQDFVGDLEGDRRMGLESLLAQNLVKFLASQSGTWGGYVSKGDEASPRVAIEQSAQIRWAFPRVEGEIMNFYVPEDTQAFQQNEWQIWEPDPARSRVVQAQELNGLLIPAIVFDRCGYRLGWGKGFYDRYLEEVSPLKVGVAFSVQISDDPLPSADHDVPVDWLITETAIHAVAMGA